MKAMTAGISGMALSVPRFRVDLDDWCRWFDNNQGKIRAVVGRSYRLPSPRQNVYTMAADAVLRLVEQYDLDPRRIGFLGLGTESSTDNSIGAVIVKGMLDRAFERLGRPAISRHCEVPEYKHACLGGIYAIKNAVRYLALDGLNKLAIVVSGDIAKYELGSTGEPTQGAGAVAMLLEPQAKLLSLDLSAGGNSSRYRGLDFRKPFSRYVSQAVHSGYNHIKDFPLFNGRYSTVCYIDAVVEAIKNMLAKRDILDGGNYFRKLKMLFMHRPYRRMPQEAWSFAYLSALGSGSPSDLDELAGYCASAEVDLGALLKEMSASPDLFQGIGSDGFAEPYPLASSVLRAFRKTDRYTQVIEQPMALGDECMQDLGNLYTAALPAWLATGLSQAATEQVELAGKETVLVGYGSGDAAEAIPARFAPEWREAAGKIQAEKAMRSPIDLTREQYESLHQTGNVEGVIAPAEGEFVVTHTGTNTSGPLQDLGIDYYNYIQGAD